MFKQKTCMNLKKQLKKTIKGIQEKGEELESHQFNHVKE